MIKDNLYTDEAFEAAVRAIVSRFLIREDWCEACKTEVNMIRLQDCDDYWKCVNCGIISKRKFSSTGKTILKEANNVEKTNELEAPMTMPEDWEIARAKIRILAEEKAKAEIIEDQQNLKDKTKGEGYNV